MHQARDVINAYWDYMIPVSVESIATRLGLTVVDVDQPVIKTCRLDQTKLIVNKSQQNRQDVNFAIAREIGRFCQSDDCEQFAADLLVPPIALKAVIEILNIRDCAKLRKMFDVTSSLLYHQLHRYLYIF